jgi:GntR family transcriptional regulator
MTQLVTEAMRQTWAPAIDANRQDKPGALSRRDLLTRLMENHIEYAKVPGIEAYENQFVALYQFLEEKFGLQIDETRDRISAKSATFMEAQVLKTEPKDALLVVHRVTYWQNRPVSIDHVRIIGSKYEVEISGKGRSK